jgi:hypothetical protein
VWENAEAEEKLAKDFDVQVKVVLLKIILYN